MACKNKFLSNKKTGQDIRFIITARESNGQLLEMESTYNSFSKEPPAHYHPYQSEDFTILSGELTVKINGQVTVLKQGECLHIPANKIHAMWNNSQDKTIVNWKVQPALNTEYLLETATGIANNSYTNDAGMPALLQVVLMASKYSGVFRMAKPAFAVQKILFALLTPFAYLAGYRPYYKKYLD